MKKLHPTQIKLLEILKSNLNYSLTIREIQDLLNLSSTSVVHHHLCQLEKKGYLKKNNNNSVDYQVISPENEDLIYLNLYGLAECGPNGRIIDNEPLDKIPISNKMFGFDLSDCFLVKANGDSMQPKIYSGDIILAKKTNDADNGSIIVCVNNEKALIKKLEKKDGRIFLNSLNEKYESIIANKDNFIIEGVVKSVLSNSF
ncbi:MAG TPA: S24 family peptidase [Spirochaetota bacterium]|nr:S24 family peptidase [Spirochaetota bacterium]